MRHDIARLKVALGWQRFPLYTLTDDFDKDMGVGEWHGTNAFFREDGEVFQTYFVNGRGDEALGTVWSFLDITALGHQEAWENSPEGYPRPRSTRGGGVRCASRARGGQPECRSRKGRTLPHGPPSLATRMSPYD